MVACLWMSAPIFEGGFWDLQEQVDNWVEAATAKIEELS